MRKRREKGWIDFFEQPSNVLYTLIGAEGGCKFNMNDHRGKGKIGREVSAAHWRTFENFEYVLALLEKVLVSLSLYRYIIPQELLP